MAMMVLNKSSIKSPSNIVKRSFRVQRFQQTLMQSSSISSMAHYRFEGCVAFLLATCRQESKGEYSAMELGNVIEVCMR